MDDNQKLKQLNWLKSLIPSAVVIDVNENGEPTNLSQLNQLSDRIEQTIQEVNKGRKADEQQ